MIKHARLKHILATHTKEREESEIEKQKPGKSMILGFVCISKIELYTSGILQQNHNMLHVSQKPNAFTTKCRGSSLEESAMGPGNFTTKCLGFPRPFF